MHLYPKDTLSYYLAAPQRHAQVLTHVSVPSIRANRLSYGATKTLVSPQQEATRFYAANHLFGLIQQRKHPLEKLTALELAVCQSYLRELSLQCQRMFYYLTIISVREARHLHQSKHQHSWWQALAPTEAEAKRFKEFQANNQGSEGAALKKFDGDPPKMAFNIFMRAISKVFYTGSFSGSFGGKPWGNISDTVVKFVEGQISAEVMLDMAYALAHNTGPIFNKGFYYTSVDTNTIQKVLDLQRAGYVCSHILGDCEGQTWAGMEMIQLVKNWHDTHPQDLSPTVDWKRVVELGAVGYHAKHLAGGGASYKKPKSAPPAPVDPITPPGTKFVKYQALWPNVKATIHKRVPA